MTDCVANNNANNGFFVIAGAGSLSTQNIIFKNCFAAQNGVCGFLMYNQSSSNLLNAAFEGCIAQSNGGDGFSLDNGIGSSICEYSLY